MRLPGLLALVLAACGGTPGVDGGSGGGGGGGSASGGGAADSGAPDAGTLSTYVRVHYSASGSHTLALRGSVAPLSWSTGVALTQAGDNTWLGTVTLNAAAIADAGQLEVKPLLDDSTWSIGPNYVLTPGATVDLYPRFTTFNGHVTKLIDSFTSTHLTNPRGIWAYIPPSYDENTTTRFPVLYMHDGQNLFDPALAFGGNEWKVDETLDQAAQDGTIAELIVIGIENTPDRIWEYTPGGLPDAGGDGYRDLITLELKPRIDSMLRTMPEREHTGVMGSSMGGLISSYLGATRPDVFGMAGVFSPSYFNDSITQTIAMTKGAAVRCDRVHISCGDQSDGISGMMNIYNAYLSAGYVNGQDIQELVQSGASHNEVYWAQRLPGALQYLFGPRANLR